MTKKLDDYWFFNIDAFIKDHSYITSELNEKKEELKEITNVKSPNMESPPGTPGRGDCVVAAVERIEKLKKDIEQLEKINEAFDYCYYKLTEREKETADRFDLSKMEEADRLGCDEKTIQRYRNNLRKKFKKYLKI